MSKSFALHVDVQVSQDALFTRFLFNDKYTRLDATLLAETNAPTRTIADGAEESLPMGDVVTGKLLYIRSTRQVTVKVTSSLGSEQELLLGTSAAVGGIFVLEGEFTAVSVENNSGEGAEVSAFIGGAS